MKEIEKLKTIKNMADSAAEKIAVSMAKLFGLEVKMEISSVNMIAVDSIPRLIGVSESDIVAGSYISFSGFLSGSALCILPIKSALEIVSILLEDMEEIEFTEGDPFTDMQESAIKEFSNIVTSSFIDVWANTFSIEVDQSPPSFACDFMAAIVDASLIDASRAGDFAFAFDSLISVTNHDVNLEVLVLPEIDSLQKVFDNIPVLR